MQMVAMPCMLCCTSETIDAQRLLNPLLPFFKPFALPAFQTHPQMRLLSVSSIRSRVVRIPQREPVIVDRRMRLRCELFPKPPPSQHHSHSVAKTAKHTASRPVSTASTCHPP